MEQGDRLTMLGITEAAGTVGLLFDPYSELVVGHVWRKVAENCSLKSVYVRHRSEERYRPLTPISDVLSYEGVVLTPNGPFMYLNIFEAIQDDGKFDGSFNWHSLQKIELPSGKTILELKAGELEPHVRHSSTWIAGIVGVGNDGETVFAQVAIPQENNWLRYCLVKLHPAQKRYELITELRGTAL